MEVIVMFTAIVLTVFVGAFVSGRRFGVLSLGLAAGSILSGFWATGLAVPFEAFGVGGGKLPSEVVATVVLLVAPAAILLFSGPKYSRKFGRVVSALAIGVLTAAFLVKPLGGLMSLSGGALEAYRFLADYWQYVVGVGLILGVLDLFMLHTKNPLKSGKKH